MFYIDRSDNSLHSVNLFKQFYLTVQNRKTNFVNNLTLQRQCSNAEFSRKYIGLNTDRTRLCVQIKIYDMILSPVFLDGPKSVHLDYLVHFFQTYYLKIA